MKLTERQADIFSQTVERWGRDSQILLALEEMSELSVELLKNLRGRDNVDKIAEELADVYVVLEQARRIYDIKNDAIQKIADSKIDRLEQRLKDGYEMTRRA